MGKRIRTFQGDETLYILDTVASVRDNPLYQEIINRICKLGEFVIRTCGIFFVCEDDGWHTIRTTEVNGIFLDEKAGLVNVSTQNSEYYFYRAESTDCSAKEAENGEDEDVIRADPVPCGVMEE